MGGGLGLACRFRVWGHVGFRVSGFGSIEAGFR